ncbi:hypothetical protein [Leptospira sarikeiensis]|uniref:Uncharacterized protein n=1 Tax=Leptospira sarikeiensis TaxID=2484943 RepID=A0A4R9KHP8_9LEPT|nr:hypothetical protein [Leptospira sarikeiensis]TGL65957.1 hypothetical protein EHQ64_00080 [Leptospira sarikeiensis]
MPIIHSTILDQDGVKRRVALRPVRKTFPNFDDQNKDLFGNYYSVPVTCVGLFPIPTGPIGTSIQIRFDKRKKIWDDFPEYSENVNIDLKLNESFEIVIDTSNGKMVNRVIETPKELLKNLCNSR